MSLNGHNGQGNPGPGQDGGEGEEQEISEKLPSGDQTRPGKRAKYTRRACEQCRRRKIKCSGDCPCSRCLQLDLDCSLVEDEPESLIRRGSEHHARPAFGLSPPPSQHVLFDPAPSHHTDAHNMTRAATEHGGRSQPTAQPHAYERLSDLENQVGVMLRAMIKAGITIPVQSKSASSLFTGSDEQAAQQHPRMDERDSGGMEADTRRGWALPGPSTMPSPEPDTYGTELALTQPVANLKHLMVNELSTAGVDAGDVADQSSASSYLRSDVRPFQSRDTLDQSHPPGQPVTTRHAGPAPGRPPPGLPDAINLRCGSIVSSVPTRAAHSDYITFYFEHIGPFHPCLNENEVRQRSGRVFDAAESALPRSSTAYDVPPGEVPFLALLSVIYACVEAMRPSPGEEATRLRGYYWYRQSQELVGKRQMTSAVSDMTGIQVLILQALYLCHCGTLDSGYAAIGRACRLCFQQGLHNASRWRNLSPFQMHMRQRVIYTVFFMDRRMAHSCGQPYGMRSQDLAVTEPAGLRDSEVFPDMPLPPVSPNSDLQPYISGYVSFANFAGKCWDALSSPFISASTISERVEPLDLSILEWLQRFDRSAIDPFAALNPPETTGRIVAKEQRLIIRTMMLDLRLLLRRSQMISLTFDERVGYTCGELASSIVDEIHQASLQPQWPSSYYVRYHAPPILFSSVLVLSTIIIRTALPSSLQANLASYRLRFQQATTIIQDMANDFPIAWRLHSQLAEVIRLTKLTMPGCVPETNLSQDPVPPAASQDIEDLFSSEIQHLAREGGFTDTVAQAGPDWLQSALNEFMNGSVDHGAPAQGVVDFSMESFLAGLEGNQSTETPLWGDFYGL